MNWVTRYCDKGDAERAHCRLLVRIQGRPVRADRQAPRRCRRQETRQGLEGLNQCNPILVEPEPEETIHHGSSLYTPRFRTRIIRSDEISYDVG